MHKHPSTTPLDKWPSAWLKFEMASLLKMPEYIILHDWEKHERHLPVTEQEMRDYIAKA